MYNLLEYSDNYGNSSGSLWQFKRDGQNVNNNNNNIVDVTTDSKSFKYKSSFFETQILLSIKCCKSSCSTKIFI